jgi:hypothetical protein
MSEARGAHPDEHPVDEIQALLVADEAGLCHLKHLVEGERPDPLGDLRLHGHDLTPSKKS